MTEVTGTKGQSSSGRKDKRNRILHAATVVFANKGFFNAKVSEIARTAGVADGTIYLYFDNKDDLLIQVFEENVERIIDQLREALVGITDPLDKIQAFVEHHFRMVEANPELAEVLTVELRQSSKFMKEYKNPKFGAYLRVITDLIEEGRASGHIRSDIQPWLASRALFGIIDELSLAWVLGRQFDLSQSASQIHSLFLNGIRSTPA